MIMTVDVEDWYQTNGLDFAPETWERYEDRVYANTIRVLDLLEELRVPATFFVLGCIARKHPGLVREICSRGHELGSHGGWHRMVNRMTLKEFHDDLHFSKTTLEQIAGAPVCYYRAPSWSIAPDRYEALEILEQMGFVCDSSLQPFRTPLSGQSDIPLYAFHPVRKGRTLGLVELPATVWAAGGIRIPFSGGFYLRFWPAWFSKFAFHRVNQHRAGMIYVHPWEFDTGFPRVDAPWWVRFIQYYGRATMGDKLRSILGSFSFMPLREFLLCETFPEVELPTPTLASGNAEGGGWL